MRFADVIAELTEKYRDDLDVVKRRPPTEAEIALWISQLELGVPSAPREDREDKEATDEDVERWVTALGVSVETLFEGVAMYLARGFQAGTLPFQFCDAVVNDLNVLTFRPDSFYATHAENGPTQGPPKLFWDIFLAFDAGEYRRPGDDRNPVTAFTRAALQEIIAQNTDFRYPDDSL